MISESAFVINNTRIDDILIGDNVVLRGILRSEYGGKIVIGNNCYIGDDCIISCHDQVQIGNNVLISHGVHIFDNDSHPEDYYKRRLHFQNVFGQSLAEFGKEDISYDKVNIGSNVWIGFNSIILKGVKIGECSIIGAGSVVTHDVPPYTFVAGNVSRRIRDLN